MNSRRILRAPGQRLHALILATLLAVTGLVMVGGGAAGEAVAATSPVADRTDVTADSLPTVQIDGVVWKQIVVGNTVYVGGQFSNARPAGSAPGTNLVPRSNILAYDIRTGVLITSFAPSINGKVEAFALSPNGATLYVGGAFTTVNGNTRNRVAAFNVATGQLLDTFAPSFNSAVTSLSASASAVYVGGQFSRVGSVTRQSLAAVRSSDGALLPWAPTTDGVVQGVALTPDGSRVIVGGNFGLVNGLENRGLASINTADGTTNPFGINQVIQNYGANQSILSLSMDAEGTVYGTGYAYGGVGPFLEGVFAANAYTGDVKWLADCHGDTYDAARSGNTIYAVSHHHTCDNIGGFPETNPRTHHRADAFTADATGTVNPNSQGGYPNFQGQPSPSIVNWFPDAPPGSFTGQYQGPWTVVGTNDYVVMGGEFPSINGVAQQGLARFAVSSKAPNKEGPQRKGSPSQPSLLATSPTRVRVKIPTNWDRDDLTLNYELQREGLATPLYQTSAQSTFWNMPTLAFDDTTVQPGKTYRYRVKISDNSGNSYTTMYVSITVPSTISAYQTAIINDGPSHYWRLGTPTLAPDYTGDADQSITGTVTTETPGPLSGDSQPASVFDGATGTTGSAVSEVGPDTFSVEAWFKTSSTTGGKIVGFGDQQAGISSNYDRHVYMLNDGRLVFGVYPWGIRTVNSSKSYNDGFWHHVVASLSSSGMVMYVDGLKVGQRSDTTWAQPYTGRWRIGGDNLNAWPDQPTSNYFNGAIDEVAVYPTALSQEQIRGHYTASGRTVDLPPAPSDPYGAAVYADAPALQWRFNETDSTTAVDSGPNGTTGTYYGGVTQGVTSPVAPGSALSLNGVDANVSTNTAIPGPDVYSTEVWFNTTTSAGGKLIAFGNQPSGTSSSYDRHVYLEPSGQLTFGVWVGASYVITTPRAYNDGTWHHVVATQSPDGMKLYVDGELVGSNPQTTAQPYQGYWRVGGDSPWSGNGWVQGLVDEAAVYDHALNLEQVRAHYRASTAATNQAPTADFTSQCDTEGSCTFTSIGSDPDGAITNYSWNFGDGSPGEGSPATHAFTVTGTYPVQLTVTDDRGATATLTKEVTVNVPPPNSAPVVAFTQTCTERSCVFDSAGTTDDGSIVAWAWDFGDGTTSDQPNPSHEYEVNGTHPVTLSVTDDRGAVSSLTQQVAVHGNVAPIASFTAECTDLACSFDAAESSDSDGTVAEYLWDFGDGSTGTGVSPEHTYAAPGSYTIMLTVKDDKGLASAPVSKQVHATPPNQVPTASFETSLDNLKVSVDASASSDPDGTVESYAWDFGDGHTGTGKTATHTYTEAGDYIVKLIVTDDDGAKSQTVSKQVTVTEPPNTDPTAAFTTDINGAVVAFDGSSSSDPDGSITGYAWDFGDGSNGEGAKLSHAYVDPGTYTVKLTVTDNRGGTDTATKQVTIESSIVADDFGRSVTRWGDADTGGTWTYVNGSYFSTNGAEGLITLPAKSTGGQAYLTGVSALNTDTTYTLKLDADPTGGGPMITVINRRISTGTDYRMTVSIQSDKAVRLNMTRRLNGAGSNLGDVKVAGLTYNAGDQLNVRFVVSGDGTATLRAKVWKVGTPEPATYQMTRTDSTAELQAPGSFGISTYLSSTATTVPVVIRLDNLRVRV